MRKIKIALHEFYPLVYKDDLGKWTGFEIKIWEHIAQSLKLDYEYHEVGDFSQLLQDLKDEKYDMAMAGITRTTERLKNMKASFYTLDTGLSIASKNGARLSFSELLKSVLSAQLLKIFAVLMVFAIAVSQVFYFIEKGHSISNSYLKGVFDSFWWSIVTFSTVGYGDISPETVLGKIFAIFAIMLGLAIFGIYIGQVSSALTFEKLRSMIADPSDLAGRKVAVKKASTSEKVLSKYDAQLLVVASLNEAAELVVSGKVDAVVADRPALLQFVERYKLQLAPSIFARQAYAFMFSKNFYDALLGNINMEIIKLRESTIYDKIYNEFFD